jgi:putative transposase
MDLCARRIVGIQALTAHTADLVLGALHDAVRNGEKPSILHSDQGSEYRSRRYTQQVETLGIRISMSRKAAPWENGYQESFYPQFKLGLGNPNRFERLGELIAEICRVIFVYNHYRIHSKLKMPPEVCALRHQEPLKGRTPL